MSNLGMNGWTATGLCAWALSGAIITTVTQSAKAQVQSVSAYYAVVTEDSGTLRCGPNMSSYSISSVPKGTVLMVDGESNGWSRVAYPSGMHAFVRAEDVAADPADAKVLRLTKPSQLIAASQLRGYTGSWKLLLDAPLATGVALTSIEPVKEGEVVVAYKVAAPPEARAWIAGSMTRRATETEVEAFRAKGNVLPSIAGAEGNRSGEVARIPTAVDVPVDVQAKQNDATPATPEATSGEGPLVTIKLPDRTANGSTTPTPGAQSQAAPVTTNIEYKEDTAALLEQTFQKVWREPVLSAEVDELIGEYERAVSFVGKDQPARKAALEQRLEALRFRRDLREIMRRQEAERVALDARQVEVNKKIEEWAANRVYTIVGVLQPSTVYDGSRLPQMYRVVSVGGTSPRTLGYIKRSSELDLDRYLGMIVGVIGERQLDVALQLNMITPVRVDPLRSPVELEIPLTNTTIQPNPGTRTTNAADPASEPR